MYVLSSACLTRLLFLFGLGLITPSLFGQYYILGRVLDDDEVPYAYAHASLRGEDYSTEQTCTELGVFRFENLKSGSYELVLVTPYGIRRRKVELRGSIDITLHVARNIQMDEISVVAHKAGDKEPVTHFNISATDLQASDYGKDMPYLLERSPSVIATSDAGNGFGYTGLRIRGTDPTRINVTLNGIPVNDAESHNVFWVDLPDLAGSATNIQIQRGIGWSQPGVGDFGGSVNINTLGFHHEPYVGIKFGGGSFNTSRTTITGGTGLIKGRFTLDERISFFKSDGYIDRANSKLNAVAVTGGYHHDATNIRLFFAHGGELTYQAWNGVPEQYINDPDLRTFNSAGAERPGEPYDNEVDDYTQNHFQLHIDQALTPFARLTAAGHYTQGKGFFEQYKADQDLADYGITGFSAPSDVVRQRWLDNDFYGFTSILHIGRPERRYFILGGGWTKYDGQHFGKVKWTEANADLTSLPNYYDEDAEKRDGNLFARSNMRVVKDFDITIDLQARWVRYAFQGPDESGMASGQVIQHRFFNPKLGMKYTLSENSSVYGLAGINHKEPNRDDYVASTPTSRPDAEQLMDVELGFRHQGKGWRLEWNGYLMQYEDQLVPTGKLNDVGAYTRINVAESHRIGMELSSTLQLTKRLGLALNGTFSDNRINEFDEYIDNWDTNTQDIISHQNTKIAFSPDVSGNVTAMYELIRNSKSQFEVECSGRYVGKQYVDNTSNEASSLSSYVVSDLGLRWTFFTPPFRELSLGLSVFNLLDEQYESNGWIYRFRSEGYDPRPDDAYSGLESGSTFHQKGYFPQAGRHLMVQLGLRF